MIAIIVLLLLISAALIKTAVYIDGSVQEINEQLQEINERLEKIDEQKEKINENHKKIKEMSRQIENTSEKIEEIDGQIKDIDKDIKKISKSIEEIQKEEIQFSKTTHISAVKLKALSEKLGVETIETKDRHYFPMPLTEIEKIVAQNSINEMEYIKESRDCDDFALIFAADVSKKYNPHPAIGIVTGICNTVGHSWNSVLSIDGNGEYQIYYIEPQLNKIIEPGEHECEAKKIVWY